MKKFIVYLLVIVLTVSLGFAIFFLVRDNEVISISSASVYKDVGDTFTIDVEHRNKKAFTEINITSSDDTIVGYNSEKNTYIAKKGGVARINFRTSNAKFRNLWCDVIVGDGTVESPFYISTAEQLASIGMGEKVAGTGDVDIYYGKAPYEKYRSDLCYKLVNNIDLTEVNNGYWIPLRHFTGRFDGNGLTLKNINIDKVSYHEAFKDTANYDENIFNTTNVGIFQSTGKGSVVYNFKVENFHAVGEYTNFGTITAYNYGGTIERIEITDAFLGVDTETFGGIVAINETTETGTGEDYERNIARIDRCSINFNLGQKYVNGADSNVSIETYGVVGVVGGLVGKNVAGTIVYCYSRGDVYFGKDSATNTITYGGCVANNSFAQLTQDGGLFNNKYQGGNIKDCYSNLVTHLSQVQNANSKFGGVIGFNQDYSYGYYDPNDNTIDAICNYIIGNYYNIDNLNATQEGINKNFRAIHTFKIGSNALNFEDTKMIAYGLSTDEMKVASNFVSHQTKELAFDENGNSKGVQTEDVLWLFDTVWSMDSTINDGMPYLNYQLIYIPDDFGTVGTPVIKDNVEYTYILYIDYPFEIAGAIDGVVTIKKGSSYQLTTNPTGVKVTWTSSDGNIVDINKSTGLLFGKDVGVATVTAMSNSGTTQTVTVIVEEPSYVFSGLPEEITLGLVNNKTYTLSHVAGEYDTVYSISPAYNTPSYFTDNTFIATSEDVSASGYKYAVITSKAVGTTKLYITAGSTRVFVNVKVIDDSPVVDDQGTTTKRVLSLKSTPPKIAGVFGKISSTGTISITPSYNKTIVTDPINYTFASTNTDVITINSTTGKYQIIQPGAASIKVTASATIKNGNDTIIYTGSLTIYVIISEPTYTINIPEAYEEITIKVGETLSLKGITFTPANPNASISYVSSNTLVASVSGTEIKGISEGTALLYVTVGSTRVSIPVTVLANNQKVIIYTNISAKSCSTTATTDFKTGTITVKQARLATSSTGDIKDQLSFKFESLDSSIVYCSSSGSYTVRSKVGTTKVRCYVTTPGYTGSAYITFTVWEKEETEEVTPLETLELGYKSAIIEVGNTLQMKVVTTATNIKYSSTKTSVATVTSGGIVKGIKAGSASINVTITRWDGSTLTKSMPVTVVAKEVDDSQIVNHSININYSTISLEVGKTRTLSVTSTKTGYTWSVANSNIATINSSGVVTGKAVGTTTITVSFADGGITYKDTCTVTVTAPPTTLTLSTTKTTMNIGDTVTLTATTNSTSTITWFYNDATLISVESSTNTTRTLKAAKAGTLTVTAKIGSVSASKTITIKTDSTAYSQYIYNYEQLNAVRYHLDKTFYLAADINMSGKTWTPIGTEAKPFTGTIKSLEKSGSSYYGIKNLTISSGDYVGLFGYTYGAKIEHFELSNFTITGKFSGALAGVAKSTSIKYAKVTNSTIKATLAAGGLVGKTIFNGTIASSTIGDKVNVTSSGSGEKHVGGIVGYVNGKISIRNSDIINTNGKISLASASKGYVGGIAGTYNGSVNDGNIYQCNIKTTITANLSENNFAGGVVGYCAGKITRVNVESTITGYNVGGIGAVLNMGNDKKSSLTFSRITNGLRMQDLSSYDYTPDVQSVAVKETTKISGMSVGGFFECISNGVVKNSYVRAELKASSSSAVKAAFAVSITCSQDFTSYGGTGQVGIIDTCYSAAKFSGSGKNISVTQSLVHNFQTTDVVNNFIGKIFGNNNAINEPRDYGYIFNYVFDDSIDGDAKHTYENSNIARDEINVAKSTTQMKTASTYTNKSFNGSIWNLTSNSYPTLKW